MHPGNVAACMARPSGIFQPLIIMIAFDRVAKTGQEQMHSVLYISSERRQQGVMAA